MSSCEICREVNMRTTDRLCSTCREAITRLSLICKREPAFLCPQMTPTFATVGAETLATGV